MRRRLLDVRPDERRLTTIAFLALFGILAAHTILETARDAMFLARLPPSQLPWMYLVIAVVAVGLSQWTTRMLSGARSLAMLLAACSAGTFAFWATGTTHSGWTIRALYVWTGLVSTLAAVQFAVPASSTPHKPSVSTRDRSGSLLGAAGADWRAS